MSDRGRSVQITALPPSCLNISYEWAAATVVSMANFTALPNVRMFFQGRLPWKGLYWNMPRTLGLLLHMPGEHRLINRYRVILAAVSMLLCSTPHTKHEEYLLCSVHKQASLNTHIQFAWLRQRLAWWKTDWTLCSMSINSIPTKRVSQHP